MIDPGQAALAAKLDELARVELDELTAFVGSRSDWECGGLLIEATSGAPVKANALRAA